MKRDFNEDHTPLGYLITFRCYGTWLHGNDKGSIDRHHNRYGAPLIPPDLRWHRQNLRSLKDDPVKLNKEQRVSGYCGNQGDLRTSQMASAQGERENQSLSCGGYRKLRSKQDPQCIESKCD